MAEGHQFCRGHADREEFPGDRYQRNRLARADVPAAEDLNNLRRHRRTQPRTGESTNQQNEPSYERKHKSQR